MRPSFFRAAVIMFGMASMFTPLALAPAHVAAAGICDAVKNKVANVRDFGAKGDGVTDDTAAIQRAANCATAAMAADPTLHAAATVYVPEGSYLISNRITFLRSTNARNGEALTVRGDGPNRSIFIVTGPIGGLFFNLSAASSWFVYSLLVQDIGFTAARPDVGPAIAIDPIRPQGDAGKRLFLTAERLSFDTRGPDAYFTYGIKGTLMLRTYLRDVSFNGDAAAHATSCFAFDHSYGMDFRNVACSGAVYGIDLPGANEGNVVMSSRIDNVLIGIRMNIDTNDFGPSASGGYITDNTIAARRRGVDITSKTDMRISGNTFSSLVASGAYQDIQLTGTRDIWVVDNTFLGAGAGRTGVQVSTGTIPWLKPGSGTIIAKNTFGALQNGVVINQDAADNYIFDNTFNSTWRRVWNRGMNTYQR